MSQKVTPILSREIRDTLSRCIDSFARGSITRTAMFEAVDKVMRDTGLNQIPLGSYRLKHLGYVDSVPVIHIQSRLALSNNCPVCGSVEWRYLCTERELPQETYDVGTAFCLDCGCYYRKMALKGGKQSVS